MLSENDDKLIASPDGFCQKGVRIVAKLEKISVTTLQKAKKCERWLYFTLTQPKLFVKTVPLLTGGLFHSVLERFFRAKGQGDTMEWKVVEQVLNEEFAQILPQCLTDAIDRIKIKENARKYLSTYIKARGGILSPLVKQNGDLVIEQFLRVKVRGGNEQELYITGKVDMITNSRWAVDHKTSARKLSQDWADKEIQGYLYPYLLKKNGLPVKGFQFNIAGDDWFDTFAVAYDEGRALEWVVYAFELQRAVAENNCMRAKSERFCKYCEFRQECFAMEQGGEDDEL